MSQHNYDDSTNTTIPLKRTRAKRSCDFCRKRKARCDADHIVPCSNCKAWGFNCEFLTVRKKRGPPSVYVENLEIRCKKMESLLTSLTKTSIKDIERNDFRFESLKSCEKDLVLDYKQDHDEQPDNDSQEEDVDEADLTEDDSIESSNHDNMEETLANLNVDDYDSIKYTGHSAGLQLLDQNLFKSKPYVQWPGREDVALRLMSQNELLVIRSSGKKETRLDVGFSLNSSIFDEKDTWKPQQNTLTDSSLPSTKLIEKALHLYFSHIHTFLPIVNRTRFETLQVKKSSSYNTSDNVLTQAILAVAFRFASRHFPKFFNSRKAALYADTYFRKVMQNLQDIYRARLRHVQAALLMTLYLDMDETADVESLQWHTLGKAIRMAQDIGLHRSCSNWDLPPSEIETRHRVFYACYILDRLMGARAGKPLTILDRDFDTELPVAHEVHDNSNHACATGPSIYHSFIKLIKLAEILGRVLKALYAPKSKHSNANAGLDDPTILAVFDRRLKNWKASLGETTEDGVHWSQAQKVNLLLLYYTVMLLLHRPFIEFSSAEKNYVQGSINLDVLAADSRQACENAASNISVIIRQKQSLMSDLDSYAPFCLPTCFVYSMFQSSLIHLAIAIRNRDSLRRLRLLQRSIGLLKQHEQLVSAQRAHHILTMLVTINGININNLLENESTEDEDQFILDDGLSQKISPNLPKQAGPNELRFANDQPVIDQIAATTDMIRGCEENDAAMPKSSWYQRMMNTSIIGGITSDLHENSRLHHNSVSRIHTTALDQLLPFSDLDNRGPTVYPHQNYDLDTMKSHRSSTEISAFDSMLQQQQQQLQLQQHDHGPTLLSHQILPRTGLTPTPVYPPQTTADHETPAIPSFPSNFFGNLPPQQLNYPNYTCPSHATSTITTTNAPSSLNWNDWNAYLGQQQQQHPIPPQQQQHHHNLHC
ncbi:fungal-specific transcription factor domain-containing protein [Parasitella parasitica]|nr:fungal-specific transcription factor domain-containing protein [Parasitella parasitica]